MPENDGLTTEISISADNTVLADMLHDRYRRMEPGDVRAELEELYGKVWTTAELETHYYIDKHDAPYAHVISRLTGATCTLAYTDKPRFYFLLQCEDADE